MCQVAEVESLGAMTSTVGQSVGADGDCQRFKRCRWALASRLAREDAGYVFFNRDRTDRVAAALARNAYTQA